MNYNFLLAEPLLICRNTLKNLFKHQSVETSFYKHFSQNNYFYEPKLWSNVLWHQTMHVVVLTLTLVSDLQTVNICSIYPNHAFCWLVLSFKLSLVKFGARMLPVRETASQAKWERGTAHYLKQQMIWLVSMNDASSGRSKWWNDNNVGKYTFHEAEPWRQQWRTWMDGYIKQINITIATKNV